MAAVVIRVRHHLCHAEIHQGSSPSCILKAPPFSSNQCLPWPVLPCSYLHRKRTALSNPAFCHSLTSFPLRLFSRSLDDTLLPNCLGPAQLQDHMRTSCRCSGAVGWLVKEPRSRMPLVTSSSAVTYFSFSLLGRVTVCLPYVMQGERTPTRLSLKNKKMTQRSELGHSCRLPQHLK